MAIPVILTVSGHDPSGGAGIQADIESIVAAGCRAASAVTCLTVQDTINVRQVVASSPALLNDQIRTLLDDIGIAVIKIGLIPNMAILEVITKFLQDHPDVPVVLDPVLTSGAGTELAGNRLVSAYRKQLLPRTTLITPNSIEARRLSGTQLMDDCGRELLTQGCQAVLITGTHESDSDVINRLYRHDSDVVTSSWPRLHGCYHGSGCTLASSAAAFIGKGLGLSDAVEKALEYTWNSLSHGDRPGKGQLLPDRLFTIRNGEASC
ncbi:MAG: hydroxymethylpyrimidine/phosphomethylpyrimidine kinase [Gammaproteobacteria bacterium]|nr:hydroxymethylpyrimidine/phosphomethylpyrimidine kinase [Gammaproteobacteria bacterium]